MGCILVEGGAIALTWSACTLEILAFASQGHQRAGLSDAGAFVGGMDLQDLLE